MTLSNTRFMTPKDWKPCLIEPLRYGNHTHRLSGYERRDGTAGKPLHPAGACVFEDKLRLQHQEARDRFKGLSVRRFHVHMPLLTVAKRQLNPLYTFLTVTLPQALPGVIASSIFVFLESLDEFTGTFFVGVPDINTLPLLLYSSSMGGNYQVASISALILLVPSIAFMLMVDKFFKADVLSKVGT